MRWHLPWHSGRQSSGGAVPPPEGPPWQPVVLECVGAWLCSHTDRVVVEWAEGPKVVLPSVWCVGASVEPLDGPLFRIFLMFRPPVRRPDMARGGVDLTLCAPSRLLPLGRIITRNLKERGKQVRARQPDSGEPPAEPTETLGIVRADGWVGFRPNPDTEELLSGPVPRPLPHQ